MDYIAAQCSVKMYRWINDEEHSQLFFTALRAVKKLDFHDITPTQPKEPRGWMANFSLGYLRLLKGARSLSLT
jgi:hypothetical protein